MFQVTNEPKVPLILAWHSFLYYSAMPEALFLSEYAKDCSCFCIHCHWSPGCWEGFVLHVGSSVFSIARCDDTTSRRFLHTLTHWVCQKPAPLLSWANSTNVSCCCMGCVDIWRFKAHLTRRVTESFSCSFHLEFSSDLSLCFNALVSHWLV